MAGKNLVEPNLGLTDRYVRIALGGLFLACGAARMARHPGLTAAAVGLLGGAMLAEGVLGICPLYKRYGINTRADGQRDFNDVIRSEGQGI